VIIALGMLSKFQYKRVFPSKRKEAKRRDPSDDGSNDRTGDSGSGGNQSDRIDCRSSDETEQPSDFKADEDDLLEQLDLIKSKSADNIKNRERAHLEHKGERLRQRTLRRNRMHRKGGGGDVGSGSDGTGIRSSDISPVDSIDEESDSDNDDDDSDCLVITREKMSRNQPKPDGKRMSKRKASASVASSSEMEPPCYKAPRSYECDSKRHDMRSPGPRSSRVESSPDPSGDDIKVKSRPAGYLTGVRKKRKKKKRRKPSKHTSRGRMEERIFQGTKAEEVFQGMMVIKKCKDDKCQCPNSKKDIIAARTFNCAKTVKERKQWLLELIASMHEDWTHFVVDRQLVCRTCFEAFYGILVIVQYYKFYSVVLS
jgi:hypothetical protein